MRRSPNHVIDDIGLGILIKSSGFKQEFLMGEGLITVDWYSSTRHLIEGLEKNVFAAFNFRISGPFGVTLLMIALVIWPHIGLFLTEGFALSMNAIVVLLRFSVFCAFACVLKFRVCRSALVSCHTLRRVVYSLEFRLSYLD